MAQDVMTTLEHIEVKNYILIGHSMGGKVAMKLAELAQLQVKTNRIGYGASQLF